MASSPDPQLLGYLLGALEEDEQLVVEEQLRRDPSLREKLVTLRKRLELCEKALEEYDPPPGLARRTCHFIAAYAETHTAPQAASTSARTLSPIGASFAGGRGSWRWTDMTMVAGICLATLFLVFPALENSRFHSRLTACQDNLRQLGLALFQYSQHHHNYFPEVPQQGTLAAAGIYAPTLIHGGYLDDNRRVVCPNTSLAADGRFRVPTLTELESASDRELTELRSTMGGSYGYSLGYVEDGRYHPTRNLARPYFALMADVPDATYPGFQSVNHGGRGQNVLYEDGHVRFLTSPRPAPDTDDVFVNDSGLVGAGSRRDDSVIAASSAVPLTFVSIGTP